MKRALAIAANRLAGLFGGEVRKKTDVYELQRRVLASGARVIFDVGASDGRVTRRYRAVFGDARIFCFEPDDARARAIGELRMDKVQVVKQALSDREGTATFYVNADPDTSSLLPSVQLGSHIDQYTAPRTSIDVETTTLDAFCNRHGIDHIDILKMDIQGGELAALHGATAMLAARKVGMIYLEVEFMELYRDQPLYHHIAQFLAERQYDLHGIFNLCSIEGERLAWADAIFVPRGR